MTRRQVLIAAAGVVGAAAVGGVVEREPLARRVRDLVEPEPAAPAPGKAAGNAADGTFASPARGGRTVGWRVAYPPGHAVGAALPVAVALHARGGNVDSIFTDLQLDRYLADVVAAGAPPFALASVDGGDHSYWHGRRDGDDPQAMVLRELLPQLARHGLRTDRVGLFGWSMGGYGALLLAETAGPSRVAAVAADSPALWRRPGETAPGAFDDAADFRRHDVFALRPRLAGIPVRIACGDRDPFYDATREFVRGVPDLAGTDFSTGGHTNTFWRRTAPAQLRFLATALSRVR